MLHLFLISLWRYFQLLARSLWPPSGSGAHRSLRRVVTLLGLMLVLGIVQLLHWLGFLLDEIFFRGYRRVVVEAPLFILGVPRSGTTHVHRMLAADPRFTTFSTWECLLGLSVTARYVARGLEALDRAIGRPVARLVAWGGKRLLGNIGEVHSLGLGAPEEDYFALVPIWACFILLLPFPYAEWIRQMAYFDRDLPAAERARILDFYTACLKKHLYVYGADRRLLSKNAAFASLAADLVERFPDAKFICCVRDPLEAAPSQLSAIRFGLLLFDDDPASSTFNEGMIEKLRYDYDRLADVLGALPENRAFFLALPQLDRDLCALLRALYAQLELECDARLLERLTQASVASGEGHSSHSYTLEGLGLAEDSVRRDFADAYARYDFSGVRSVLKSDMAK